MALQKWKFFSTKWKVEVYYITFYIFSVRGQVENNAFDRFKLTFD